MQIPDPVLEVIFSRLRPVESMAFRLTCRKWRHLCVIPIRRHFGTPAQEQWGISASSLKTRWPDATTLFNFNGNIYPNQAWVNTNEGDAMSVALEPGVMCPWTLQHPEKPLNYDNNLRHLQRMQSGLKAHHGTNKLELLVRTLSTQTVMSDMKSALASVAANIVHLRVLESLPQCLNNLPPLTALRTLEFRIPNDHKQVPLLQAAVTALYSLEALHVFATTLHTTENMGRFLQVLSACSNITSLRVVTENHVASISSNQLHYIKRLSLSQLVHFDKPPTQLQHLHLQRVQHNLETHLHMLTQLELMGLVPSIEIEACSPAALLYLPKSLASLTLHEPFKQDQVLEKGEVSYQGKADLYQVFARLSSLRILRIGNFFSDFLVGLFRHNHMPLVHTFGFCIHPLGTPGFLDQANHTRVSNNNRVSYYRDGMTSGNMILSGPSNLTVLQQALPSIQYLEASFISHTGQQTATLQTSFLQQLKELCGLTCICENTNLTLEEEHLPDKCYAIFKGLAVH